MHFYCRERERFEIISLQYICCMQFAPCYFILILSRFVNEPLSSFDLVSIDSIIRIRFACNIYLSCKLFRPLKTMLFIADIKLPLAIDITHWIFFLLKITDLFLICLYASRNLHSCALWQMYICYFARGGGESDV